MLLKKSNLTHVRWLPVVLVLIPFFKLITELNNNYRVVHFPLKLKYEKNTIINNNYDLKWLGIGVIQLSRIKECDLINSNFVNANMKYVVKYGILTLQKK